MFTTGSKLLVGSATLTTIAAVVYGITQAGALGTVGLSFAAMSLFFLAGINVYTRDADVSAMDAAALTDSPAAAPPPEASMWPAIGALGATLVAVGLITDPVVLVFGLIVLLATTVEWMLQGWSERASADPTYNAGLRGRLAHPFELPLLAAVGLGTIIYSFSRIMLVLSKAGGPAAFGVIAALILLAGFLIAYRPTAKTSFIAGVSVLASLGLVAGGVAAALEGERDIHVFETTVDLAREGLCDTVEETEADERASQTVAAKANIAGDVILRDDGTLVVRNLGIPGDQGRMVVTSSNPTNVRFRNETGEDRRLLLDLGTRPEIDEETGDAIEGTEMADQRCTALVEEGGSQLMSFEIATPSAASDTPYVFRVPGVDGAEVEVVVP